MTPDEEAAVESLVLMTGGEGVVYSSVADAPSLRRPGYRQFIRGSLLF